MHVERLQRIAALLRAVDSTPIAASPKQFSMLNWYCDVSACAIGLAALDPWFQKQGLRLRSWELNPKYAYPVFGEHTGAKAVQEFFEISEAHATELFGHEYSPTDFDNPLAVVKRIDVLLAQCQRPTPD